MLNDLKAVAKEAVLKNPNEQSVIALLQVMRLEEISPEWACKFLTVLDKYESGDKLRQYLRQRCFIVGLEN